MGAGIQADVLSHCKDLFFFDERKDFVCPILTVIDVQPFLLHNRAEWNQGCRCTRRSAIAAFRKPQIPFVDFKKMIWCLVNCFRCPL